MGLGAMACTVCSIAILFVFLAVLVGLLLMPGASKPEHLKSGNSSNKDAVGSDVAGFSTPANSSASTATPASGLPGHTRQRLTRVSKSSTAVKKGKSTTVSKGPKKATADKDGNTTAVASAKVTTTPRTETPSPNKRGGTTTTAKPIPVNTLICILNADMNQKEVSQLPEDGLCDLAFYQADEKEHAIVNGSGGPFKETLELVVQAAANHTKTEYGVSFDYSSMKVTRELLSTDVARTTLEELWNKKIYHYAFLTLPFFHVTKQSYRKVFYYLKDVSKILHKGLPPPRPCFFLIGETFVSEVWLNYAFNNIRERMHVHGTVVYGHMTFDDRGQGQVVPPSFWNSTLLVNKQTYQYNLDSAHWALKMLPLQKLGYTRFFLSVTTGARYYAPVKDAKYEILADTDYNDEPVYIDIGQVCKHKDWSAGFREESPTGAYYANTKIHRMVTYDNEKSFRAKLCKGKRLITEAKYGFAIYDANLDDPGNVCGDGAYSRVRYLKKLMHFFIEKFNSANDYDECMWQ
ncbi:uncharacterized protein [Dermacentor andersoni]|uniref:uncharacterized protein n=1 Tax=Dermacentor andersoni TaxID=34620 RepID=UPI0024167D93|nr:uncharacterized protein LOC126527476 [Dermacentor andersoni]XP_054924558.1 uncharacterized protein LOC126527476 [Dermacentor andersoni]